jgi:hypothetical protein
VVSKVVFPHYFAKDAAHTNKCSYTQHIVNDKYYGNCQAFVLRSILQEVGGGGQSRFQFYPSPSVEYSTPAFLNHTSAGSVVSTHQNTFFLYVLHNLSFIRSTAA